MTQKKEKGRPFQFLDSINTTKENLIENGTFTEKQFSQDLYIINKGLSLFPDTILLSNMMNINYNISPKMQYDFYLNSVRNRKRFSKWPKSIEKNETFIAIQEYYKYNDERVNEILSLLTDKDIKTIKKKINKGGIK